MTDRTIDYSLFWSKTINFKVYKWKINDAANMPIVSKIELFYESYCYWKIELKRLNENTFLIEKMRPLDEQEYFIVHNKIKKHSLNIFSKFSEARQGLNELKDKTIAFYIILLKQVVMLKKHY